MYDHDHGDSNHCWNQSDTHIDLMQRINDPDLYDGFVLHTSASALPHMLRLLDRIHADDYRVMAWVKPFAAFKANVSVAYAWEPVIVKAARKPEVTGRMVMRDWISEPITLRRGLTGAKPERVCMWAFEMVGAHPDDDLVDLFPGTGAVSRAWEKWRGQLDFAFATDVPEQEQPMNDEHTNLGESCENCDHRFPYDECVKCGEPWPCETARLRASLRRVLDAEQRLGTGNGIASLLAAIADARESVAVAADVPEQEQSAEPRCIECNGGMATKTATGEKVPHCDPYCSMQGAGHGGKWKHGDAV